MKTYKNLSGKSGVLAYEVGKTYIRIKFSGDSMVYTYDYKRPGRQLVEQMKDLALKGKGLSDFIVEKVGANFSSNK
jgi:hypothetical protein